MTYKHTEETKRKLSKAMKDRKKTEEHKRKIGLANKGKVSWIKGLSKETDERVKRISEKNMGKKISEEQKQKLSERWKGEGNPNYGKTGKDHPRFGKHHTKETLKKMSGKNNHGYGKSLTEEHKQKIKKAGKCGKDHPQWKGGKSKNDKLRRVYANRKTNKEALVRDNHTCRTCKTKDGKMHCHHIYKFSDSPELRFVLENKITLCEICHKVTEGIEEQFEKLFWFMNIPKKLVD